jgi:peptidoglycan hydrolase-like protein with peptidoglycan-binding domain
MRPQNRPRTAFRTLLATTCAAVVAASTAIAGTAAWPTHDDALSLVAGANPATPGDFTGYGFDQCLTPTQAKMDAWLDSSPFLSVGVYISGNSRACRSQPNLTPTWMSTQLAKGWRVLPITLGPQSTCVGRFPRYGATIDPTISTSSTNAFEAARVQARAEAENAVVVAQGLGIVPGSTLYYDLEGWSSYADATCRESALAFLTAWTQTVKARGYLSGVYSSAGSGIKIIDDARAQGRGDVALPDQLWIARWDGAANTSTSYISEAGWNPHARIKQYQGGHDETWGGVTINIDRNFLDVGRGSWAAPESHCGGINLDYTSYPRLAPGASRPEVRALKCLLREQGYGGFRLTKGFGPAAVNAAVAWQRAHGFATSRTWRGTHWRALLAQGATPVLKVGSAGPDVRRVQRALNAGIFGLAVTGLMDPATRSALTRYQSGRGVPASAIMSADDWSLLQRGR